MTKLEFLKVMAVLEAGTGKSLKADQVDVWFQGLSDLPLEGLQGACLRYLKEGDDWPSIAKIRRLAVGDTDLDVKDRAVAAWDICFRAIKDVGGYASVEFDDPLINAVIRSLGGWERLCETETAELVKWTRKDFERTYGAFSASGVGAEQVRPLVGFVDRTNGSKGYRIVDEPQKVASNLPPNRNFKIRGTIKPRRKALPSPEVKKLVSSFSVELPKRQIFQEPERTRDEQIKRLENWNG